MRRDEAASVLPLTCAGVRVVRAGRTLLDLPVLRIEAGERVAVVGPNGAGKSLLFSVLNGLSTPDHGSVAWGGRAPHRAGYRRLSALPQRPVVLRRSAASNVDYALRVAGVGGASIRRARVDAALARAGLSALADRPAEVLSGGEAQRLALARALAIEPELLMLDEPTAGLDPASIARFEATLQQALEGGLTLCMVTHDLAQARRLCDRVLMIHSGRLVEDARTADFLDRPPSAIAAAFVAGELLIET